MSLLFARNTLRRLMIKNQACLLKSLILLEPSQAAAVKLKMCSSAMMPCCSGVCTSTTTWMANTNTYTNDNSYRRPPHNNNRNWRRKPSESDDKQQRTSVPPAWVQRMHQSLLTSVDLPPYPQDRAGNFDARHMESLSVDKLVRLAWLVNAKGPSSNALMVELWRRFDEMSVEQIISVADIFFMNGVQSIWYTGAITARFMEKADFLELTPLQLTRLVFHVLDPKMATPPGFCLFLEELIMRNIDYLTLNELAIILHSYFTSKHRIHSLELMDTVSRKLITEFHTLNNWYLPVFMKMFRYSNFIKVSFYKDLGDKLIELRYLSKFRTLAQIMHIAHAYASVRISHPPLFSYILETCCQATYEFRLKDLSKLIWSCGTLVTDSPNDIAAIQRILTYLEYNLSLEVAIKHPDNVVDMVSGLCFLNIYSDYLLNLLFHPKMVRAIYSLGKGKNKTPQLHLIDSSLKIDYPNYSGLTLDQRARDSMMSRLGSFPLESELAIIKGMKQVLDALQQTLGEDKVMCTKILPHFTSSDICLVWDTKTSQFISHEDYSSLSNEECPSFKRLVVQVLRNMQTSYNGQSLGILHMKQRQLDKMGYQSVLIDADQSLQFIYSDEGFIQQCLDQQLSTAVGSDLSHLLLH